MLLIFLKTKTEIRSIYCLGILWWVFVGVKESFYPFYHNNDQCKWFYNILIL